MSKRTSGQASRLSRLLSVDHPHAPAEQSCRPALSPTKTSMRGFSLIELVVVVVIVIVMVAIAVPQVQSTVAFFRFRGGIQQVKGAIQRTRFQALSQGVPYQLTFDSSKGTYQVSHPSDFTNFPNKFDAADPVVPLTGTGLSLATDITYQFRPSGTVVVTPANASASITDGKRVSTVNVSSRGSVTVTVIH